MDNETAEIAISNDVNMTNNPESVKITGIGERLKKAREAMHLTEKEAAARLYLNPKIILIIENETFADGPPITFMRGYLRSYARMLNLPENEIQAGLNGMESAFPQPKTTAPALHATPINYSDRYIRWITYLIVITLIALVCLWWNSHSKYVIADVPSAEPSLSTDTMETPDSATNTPAAASTDNTDTQTSSTPAAQATTAVNTAAPSINNKATQAQAATTVNTTASSINNKATQATPTANTAESNKAAQAPAAITQPVQTSAQTPAITATPTAERDGSATSTEVKNASTGTDASPKKHKKHRKHKSIISNMAIALPD